MVDRNTWAVLINIMAREAKEMGQRVQPPTDIEWSQYFSERIYDFVETLDHVSDMDISGDLPEEELEME